jgi:hypothetical protein
MRFSCAIVGCLVSLSVAGCGHISTYTDPKLTRGTETGILYYPPKPYLLVSRTGAKDKPNDVQVVYLPDLSQPRYAVMKSGFGSSNLALTFSNGVLVSTSQQTDPKIVELITALAGVPTSLATAAKTRAEAGAIRAEASDYPGVARTISSIADDIAAIADDQQTWRVLIGNQIEILRRLPQQLRQQAVRLADPATNPSNVGAIIEQLEATKKQLSEIKPAVENPAPDTMAIWNKIRTAEANLAAAIGELKPKEAAPPTLSLYEVIITPAGTSLREVPITTLTTGNVQTNP